jgi:excisionase family DNA binding protein
VAPNYTTRQQLAATLGVSLSTVDAAIKRGEIQAIKIGTCVRVVLNDDGTPRQPAQQEAAHV